MSAVAEVNRNVRVEPGTSGTIVVVSAWCPTCKDESLPHSVTGDCTFCGTTIVDYDTLNARELRKQLDGPEMYVQRTFPAAVPSTVVPIRHDVEIPTLQVADGCALPVDVAGEATAILAKRGAGKTNTGRVLAEEYHRAGVQLCIIDPIGVWWGLRSSADGEHDGLPIPILGGEHGDLPLGEWAGSLTAAVVVESGMSVILDLSDLSKDEQRTFVADFAEELYRLKRRERTTIHVMLEEADEFAPQRARAGGDAEELSRMRGAVEQLARRGRSSGIGLTMITQRSAALSKDVLTQADTLIAMRTTGPTDIKAIQEWVTRNADGGNAVVRSLPGLQTGESWIWSPERDLLARVQVRLAWTWDSSSTPKYGQERVEPRRRASVELPLALDRLEQKPAPVLEDDYRLQDDDGLWGCKIEGCDGRSALRAGPTAYLCPHHGGRAHGRELIIEDDDEVVPAGTDLVPGDPVLAPEPLTVDGTTLFGITGHFARDAERVRVEAARIRQQADTLDAIAEQLDQLAALQEPA